jgi:hypothetical protein
MAENNEGAWAKACAHSAYQSDLGTDPSKRFALDAAEKPGYTGVAAD